MEALDLPRVQRLLSDAVSIAQKRFSRPVCVSVCDSYGFLIGFYRMDGGPVRSIQLSQQKAYTSVRMGVSTEAFLARLRREDISIGYFCDPLLTALPGGAVLNDATGRTLGGVGISGLTPAEDQALADELASSIAAGHQYVCARFTLHLPRSGNSTLCYDSIQRLHHSRDSATDHRLSASIPRRRSQSARPRAYARRVASCGTRSSRGHHPAD
ncbi:GlcG/HbpS family heme-binding protein [Paraburkholderia adhaesiva]|uniref:GlcG/HbpS family heme-binding protein n=1 Tax=Paraburkholderia adhaesiva TaxID=2883244 RepID=UPI001F268926|nr:heme-binding protein [Paraburkholderia adhaesiva]